MSYINGLTMKFPVKGLLEKLVVNRARHETIAKEAQDNYLIALKGELETKLENLIAGRKINPNSKLPVPGDNLDEYDTAISMLSFTSDIEIELTQDQYHSYVEDKWVWQRDFLTTSGMYSNSASNL